MFLNFTARGMLLKLQHNIGTVTGSTPGVRDAIPSLYSVGMPSTHHEPSCYYVRNRWNGQKLKSIGGRKPQSFYEILQLAIDVIIILAVLKHHILRKGQIQCHQNNGCYYLYNFAHLLVHVAVRLLRSTV